MSFNVEGAVPEGKAHFRSKPDKSGSYCTPEIISHNFSASFATTSLTVSPVHKSIQAMSGPCQITQLDEILLHPFVSELDCVGIIDILFFLVYYIHVYV